MKSIKKVFICTLAAITMAAPISVFAGADIGNTNYYGTYTCPESSKMYLWVRSGSVDLQKVYYNGLYNSAADSSSAFVRLDQFAATYSDYLSYTSLDAPVKINHTSLNIDGSYKPREYFNISGKKYNMD